MVPSLGSKPSLLQERNRRLVLDILRSSEDITISLLAQRTKLSSTTLLKIIDYFMGNNLILGVGKGNAADGGGKKPALYRFNASYGYVISITLFGTSLLLALTDARARIFHRETFFLEENKSLQRVVDIVAAFIAKWQEAGAARLDEKAKLLGIVIASNGVIDPERGICLTASRCPEWGRNAPLKDLIRAKVEFNAPFIIDNANRFFAFADKTLGCARDKKSIITVVAGYDGLGAGIISDDRIERGPHYLSGEVGHMCLNPLDEETCHCGGRGCFEQLVSCQRLVARAESGRVDYPDSRIFWRGAAAITLQDIFDASNEGDEFACLLMDEVIRWFAIGFNNMILVFNPEAIIISGDYRSGGPYFLRRLSEIMEKVSLIRMKKDVEIRYSSFDEEGAILGGASYVLHDFFVNRLNYS